MTFNADLATMSSNQHKIRQVHYQTHHQHYHVRQILTSHHQYHHELHLHNHTNSMQNLEKPQDLNSKDVLHNNSSSNDNNNNNNIDQQDQILPTQKCEQDKLANSTLTDLSLLNTNHFHLEQQQQSPQNKLHHQHNHQQQTSQTVTRKITTTRCSTTPQFRRDQQLSLIRSRRQTAAKLRQKSQIQFIMFAAFAYILSPIDLIPEVVFGVFGILDDLLFLFMCLFCIAIILIYPIFREMRRTIFEKLGLQRELITTHHLPLVANKSF